MGIALGGAEPGVAQQPPLHLQGCPARDPQGGEGVAQILDVDVGDIGLDPDALPSSGEIGHRPARHFTRKLEGVARWVFSRRCGVASVLAAPLIRMLHRPISWPIPQ